MPVDRTMPGLLTVCRLFFLRNVLQKARELNLQSLGMCVINSVRRNYPPDRGAHIALRKYSRWCTSLPIFLRPCIEKSHSIRTV